MLELWWAHELFTEPFDVTLWGGKVNKTWFKDTFLLTTVLWQKVQIVVLKTQFVWWNVFYSFWSWFTKAGRKEPGGGRQRCTGGGDAFKLLWCHWRQLKSMIGTGHGGDISTTSYIVSLSLAFNTWDPILKINKYPWVNKKKSRTLTSLKPSCLLT